ncbi:AraC family ligand binding domain-containing protein [Blautia sp. RD014234]|nr:AraC family ligand binding domain-containing protein [Blautia parvula]
MKKRKPKMEFRYYKIPADSHMLPLTGENLKQCYGVEVDYLHFHNHMEIGYCYYGEGTLSLENTKHEFQGGMFSIIPRNFPHTTNSKLNTISSWEYLFLDVSSIISQFHQANPILSDKIIRQINKKHPFSQRKIILYRTADPSSAGSGQRTSGLLQRGGRWTSVSTYDGNCQDESE